MARRAPGSDRFVHYVFAAFAIASVYPLWQVRYTPIQDLPQHLAAIRVLFDYSNPRFGFETLFELDPLRTQYLAYYAAVGLLSKVIDLELANHLVMSTIIIATPYAVRGLLTALGRDRRVALLVFPLTYNAHLILGFLNFLGAIPLAMWAMTLAVRERRAPRSARALGIGLLALACFFAHVVPFALMVVGIALIAVGESWRASLRRLAPLLPACLVALAWLFTSLAGKATLAAASGGSGGPEPVFQPWSQAVASTPMWMTDVWGGDFDRMLLWGWLAVVAFTALIAPWLGRRESAPDAPTRGLQRRLWVLPALCVTAYFVAPVSYDWIWPIAQRFPLLAGLFLIATLPQPGRAVSQLVIIAAVVLSSAHLHVAGSHCARFDRDEVGDFDGALARIPARKRVVGLIFDRGSANVRFSPFLHFVAYYQARKGGAVMFTFADFPHSPFRFREDDRPPRVPPRWEWMPERVRPQDLGWYDYALVRGGPGRIARSSDWSQHWRGRRWSVYRRNQ